MRAFITTTGLLAAIASEPRHHQAADTVAAGFEPRSARVGGGPSDSRFRLSGISGFGQSPVVAGHPKAGFRQLYESNLFISAPNNGITGPTRRLGAPPGAPPRWDGFFSVDNLPSGRYSLLVSQPVFWIRPKVVANVTLQAGIELALNITLTPDFSTAVRVDKQWPQPGTCWYQTFLNSGVALSSVSMVLAGASTTTTAVTAQLLTQSSSAPVTAWPPIASAKPTLSKIGTNTDLWIRWRSSEVPLTPGQTYALKLCGVGGDIQPYYRAKDANSYSSGTAYDVLGRAQAFDLNAVVFTDNDGTAITLIKRTPGVGDLRDGFWGKAWGQSFTATGSSLAAVDSFLVGANHDWNITVQWSVHKDNPSGVQIGPPKTTFAAFQADGYGLHGVSYQPGEVPLVVGHAYTVVIRVVDPPFDSDGFNPSISDDAYKGGHGWQSVDGASWMPRPNVTIAATVMEWRF